MGFPGSQPTLTCRGVLCLRRAVRQGDVGAPPTALSKGRQGGRRRLTTGACSSPPTRLIAINRRQRQVCTKDFGQGLLVDDGIGHVCSPGVPLPPSAGTAVTHNLVIISVRHR